MRPTTIPAGKSLGREHFRTFLKLLPYLWPKDRFDLKVRVAVALALLVAAKLTNIVVPLLLREAVDALSVENAALLAVPLALLLAYGAARVLALGFGELRDALFARVAQQAIREVTLKAFRHLLSLSLRFHLERQTGALNRALDRGTKSIEFLLFFVMFNVVPTIFEILLVCGILWWLFDWRFAAVPALTIGAFIWFTFKVTELRIRYRREMNDADNEASARGVDALINYETVKYFGSDSHEADRYDGSLRQYQRAAERSKVSLSLLNSGQALIVSLGVTALMIFAAFGVVAGRMTVGDFVMVNAYLIQVAMPLNLLGTVYREIKQSLIDLEAIFALLERPSEVQDPADGRPLPEGSGAVAFEKVSFGYDPRRPILKDVSFTVPPGRTVAIVGPSGAGKSTIGRLLFRFYDVTDGRVVVDGADVRTVTQASLRGAIGVVPQDSVLFNDTVYYNIAYGRPGAEREEVEEAARLARIHDFIEGLPDGYQTIVGERGLKLSGGEKQRVAIARTMLKKPRILLFDEATSSLDSATEQEIQRSLDEVSRDRTTVVIAHRLSTVVGADEILVMAEGRIIERGNHEVLLGTGGAYADMWARQQRASKSRKGEEVEAAE